MRVNQYDTIQYFSIQYFSILYFYTLCCLRMSPFYWSVIVCFVVSIACLELSTCMYLRGETFPLRLVRFWMRPALRMAAVRLEIPQCGNL